MSEEVDFCMPSLGADMDAGTVTEWCVKEGDRVRRGDIVAVVATEKSDIDIEVWHSGVLTEILVPAGQPVRVGTPIARLRVDDRAAVGLGRPAGRPPDGETEATDERQPAKRAHTASSIPEDGMTDRRSPAPAGGRLAASPLARRLASELGIDLDGLRGTGPGGAILARDVSSVSIVEPESIEAPRPDRRAEAAEAMRRAIARSMGRSKREIPHYYLAQEVDLETALTWLEQINAARPVQERILPAALLLKAVAAASASLPQFNGFWEDDQFRAGDGVHLGVAISLRGGGLIAPAIHDADRLALPELMTRLRDVVERTRQGRLRGSEISDATITITNLGDRGVDLVHGVIYPPQVALVGFGRIDERPTVVDHQLRARRTVTVTLAADHRATDGAAGARFLVTIEQALQKPEAL